MKNSPAFQLLFLVIIMGACHGATIHAQPRRGNPEHPDWYQLRPYGVMKGMLTKCAHINYHENFGQSIIPVGDVDHDGMQDFCIGRQRCDQEFDHFGYPRIAVELLLYRGVAGRLPEASSFERIGPSDSGHAVYLLASGDWDADGNRDLAISLGRFNDSSAGNTEGWDIGRLIILWGNFNGQFNFTDTTQLSCGLEVWNRLQSAVSADVNGDRVEDLVILGGSGVDADTIVLVPRLLIFKGDRTARWGRDGRTNRADWSWWVSQHIDFYRMQLVDHDCDGYQDIIGFRNTDQGTGSMTIVYGRAGGFPDTNEVESVDLSRSNHKQSVMTDITGDGVPELCISAGSQEKIKIYAGKPGQRLKEQYGTGIDPPDPANGRPWARPWAEIWLPFLIHDGWESAGFDALFAPGDLNLDGNCDLCAISYPFLICYSGGRFTDSLIDAEMYIPQNSAMVNLGDIDGSGRQTIAVQGINEVVFLKPNDSIPTYGGTVRQLPHPLGFRCSNAAEVTEGSGESNELRENQLHLEVSPNPSSDEVHVQWSGGSAEEATITISNAAGQELQQIAILRGSHDYYWSTVGWATGVYFITLHQEKQTLTSTVIIR